VTVTIVYFSCSLAFHDTIVLNLCMHHLEPSYLIAHTDPVTPATASLRSAAISRAPRRTWTAVEDTNLREAVATHDNDWVAVASMVPGRDNGQCRKRWVDVLDKWTPEEDAKLRQAVKDHVEDWVAVGKLLVGRTDGSCWERWHKIESTTRELPPETETKLAIRVQKSLETWSPSSCAGNLKPVETTTEDIAPPGVNVDVSPQQPTSTRPRKAAARKSRDKAAREKKDASDDDSISAEPTPRQAKKSHFTLDTDHDAAGLGFSQPSAIAESDYDSDKTATSPLKAGDSPITKLTDGLSELSFSACNTFGKALNSSDTHLGAELLTFATTFSKQVPNESLCKILRKLIMFGPNSEGTWFPDCQRMELATNYMSLLLSKPGFADKLSGVAKPSFWEECLDQMTAPMYCVAGDEHRISAAAIERTGQSLRVKVCCAELFLDLLSRELKGFVRKQHEPDTETLCTKPIVKHILDHPRRGKEALEKSLKACTQLWSMYGHFILCDLPDLEAAMDTKDGPSDVSVHFVRSQASRLVKVMGKLCSYFAWLYGVDASEGIMALACLINANAPQELEETNFETAPFLDAADYSKEVRLNFLLNLDKRCVPQLKPALAGLLEVVTKYNAIFG
jgi:hypothetical protein